MDPHHAALVQGETVAAWVLGDALLAGGRRPRVHGPGQLADVNPLALSRPAGVDCQPAALVEEVRQGGDEAALRIVSDTTSADSLFISVTTSDRNPGAAGWAACGRASPAFPLPPPVVWFCSNAWNDERHPGESA